MGAMTESQVLGVEMEKVNPKVSVLFDRDDTFYADIEKSKNVEKVSARDMRVPLELRPGGYFGHYDPDGGDLGSGAGPTWDKGTVPVVHLKYAIQWTKKSEWATDDSRKAVVNTFRHLMAKAMKNWRRHVDALCMTDGTGVLGVVSAVSTAAGVDTITLNTDGYGARLLRYGQKYNVYDTTLATNRTAGSEKEITFYDGPNKQIKGAATTGIIVGDKIVVSGVTATPPVSMYGVPYHSSASATGSWMGLDRATVPEIRGNRVNAGTTALALAYARLALNKIGDRLGMDEVSKSLVAWMHPCQKQAYEALGQLAQHVNRTGSKDPGLSLYFNDDMQIAGCPIRTSFSWDKTRIDFIVRDVWGRAEMQPAGFYEVDGRKIFELRGPSGGVAASQVFYLCASFNLFNMNPVAGSYIDALTVPSGY